MPRPKRILIYGFEPFKRYKKNITEELIKQLPEAEQLLKYILPVRFEAKLFLEPATQIKPDYILGLGQCHRGKNIRIERKAHNHQYDRSQELDQSIVAEGPEVIFSTWPIPINSQRRYSYHAGRYVCNYSMYQMGLYAQEQNIRCGFLHIPRTYPIKTALKEVQKILESATNDVI